MIRRLIATSAVFAVFSLCGLAALAQNFGMSGSRGGGMGSSGFGSSAFGSGGMGGGGFGSSGFGGGGFGSSGFGGGGFGNSGFGSGMGGGFGSSGVGGNSAFGNSGFGNSYGGGMGGGQNFVGRDAADMQATFGQMGAATTQFMNNMNRSMNRSNRRSNKQTVQNVAQPMRVEVKVAFTPPRPTSDQMATVIRTRLTRILAERQMSQPTVSMEGDTAVVSGVAASENERAVIGQLLAIEPGIRTVRNEMTVGQPAGPVSGIAPSPGS